MGKYVNSSTKAIYTIHDIRAAHPNLSIPSDADCSALGYAFLIETPRPDAAQWHSVVEGAPDADNQQTWTQVPLLPDEIRRRLVAAVDAMIEDMAVAGGWDSRITCTMRAGLPNSPWRAHGVAFGEWMDRCYAYIYQVEAAVAAGSRSVPTEEALVAEILAANPMAWPV